MHRRISTTKRRPLLVECTSSLSLPKLAQLRPTLSITEKGPFTMDQGKRKATLRLFVTWWRRRRPMVVVVGLNSAFFSQCITSRGEQLGWCNWPAVREQFIRPSGFGSFLPLPLPIPRAFLEETLPISLQVLNKYCWARKQCK